MLRHRGDKAGLIVHKTGQRSVGAGQGLPCVAMVDAATAGDESAGLSPTTYQVDGIAFVRTPSRQV